MRPAFEIMEAPIIGLVSLAIILGSWFAGVRYPGGVPGGLVAIIVVTAVPFGIYDFIEAMDNVESASAAGDDYSEKEAIGAEGVISLVGTLLGSPFANAVYIGHPGWKGLGPKWVKH